MAKIYTKNTWTDEVLGGAERYRIADNAGVTINDNVIIELKTAVVQAGSAVDAAKMNNIETGLDALDTKVSNMEGGSATTDQDLKEWAEGGDYELTSITYDTDGIVTTATVKWPDGSAGAFTTTTKNTTWKAVDAYTISHTVSNKTVTQAAVTRDSGGNVTTKPALTVA